MKRLEDLMYNCKVEKLFLKSLSIFLEHTHILNSRVYYFNNTWHDTCNSSQFDAIYA